MPILVQPHWTGRYRGIRLQSQHNRSTYFFTDCRKYLKLTQKYLICPTSAGKASLNRSWTTVTVFLQANWLASTRLRVYPSGIFLSHLRRLKCKHRVGVVAIETKWTMLWSILIWSRKKDGKKSRWKWNRRYNATYSQGINLSRTKKSACNWIKLVRDI